MTETAQESVETCRNGHPRTPENTRRRVSSGKPIRQCRTCAREAARRRLAARRSDHREAIDVGVASS